MRQKAAVEAVEQAEVAEEAVEQAATAGPAARVGAVAWWCPNDDRAMSLDVATCDACGYERV